MDQQALLQHAMRLHQGGDIDGARRCYEALLRQDKNHFIALANLASLLARQGEQQRARAFYRRALRINDREPGLWFNYANLCHKSDEFDEAERAFRTALELDESLSQAWFNLGNLLRDRDMPDEAEEAYRRCIEQRPDFPRAYTNLGNLLRRHERPAEAVEIHQQARLLDAQNPEVRLNLANALVDLRRFPEAEASLNEGLKLAPGHPEILLALGRVYMLQEKDEAAVQCWHRILADDPAHGDAHFNLGIFLFQLKKNNEAVAHLRQAVAADPTRQEFRSQLGFTLTELGQLSEAREIAERLTAQDPENPKSWMLMGFVAVQASDIALGLDAFARIRELDPGLGIGVSNTCFSSLYADFHRPEDVTAIHKEMSSRVTEAVAACALPPRVLGAGDRIRVGYLSPDFRSHPVGFFMEPVLENHDHESFEVFGYGLQSRLADETGKSLVSHLDHWLLCNEWDDEQLTSRIRADELDILVDLGGYTASCKMPILARRVAPVQAIYLGYPCTTGMSEMDRIIGDPRVIPGESSHLYTEQPAHLPHSFLCFQPRPGTPDVAPAPCHENGHVTFGSFNNLPKLSDRCIALWARVLEAVPGSKLLLKALALSDAGTRQRVLERFEQADVTGDRVELVGPTTPITKFLGEYGRIDIALDTLPYNGGTTTCDALWMGVPVVSLAGKHFYERMGCSILDALGRPEWVAHSEEEYVAAAVGLAHDPEALSRRRTSLRDQMQTSPLCDAVGFTRGLESLYQQMVNPCV